MAVHDLAMLAAAIGIGYLFGSIPFAILVERWKKVDVRRFGSGNLGAANAFVVGGKLVGLLVLFGDITKGIAAVVLVAAATGGSQLAMGGAAVGAVVGHDWSLYLRLRGGKGTATTVGVLLALDWRVLALLVVTYFVLLGTSRYTVVSSLLTIAFAPVLMFLRPWFAPGAGAEPQPFIYAAIILAALGYLRHWDHVERFIQGREPKAGDMFRQMRARRVKS